MNRGGLPVQAHLRPSRWRARSLRASSFALALLGAGCAKGPAPTGRPAIEPGRDSPWIRVALVEGRQSLTFELVGPALMRCCAGETRLWQAGQQIQVRLEQGVTVLEASDNDVARSRRPMRVEALHPSTAMRFGEHAYRGTFEVLQVGQGLTLVNEVDLEAYLRGVVPWEIGWQDPQRRTAVEAQAIAARTYAYKRLGQHADSGFDVYADVMDQVYQGTTREDSIANGAIAATRGTVLLDGDELVEAYYCSTCGGHTSRIESVWPKPAERYLKGRRDRAAEGGATFCAASNHFRWQEAWSGAELEELLQQTLPPELATAPSMPLAGLVDLYVDAYDETGRARHLVVETTGGTYRVAGDRIRWVLRPRERPILRSTMFKLDVQREENGVITRVIARGGGNGHGVGMCQVGALEMARRGYDASSILAHYYPGTRLRTLY